MLVWNVVDCWLLLDTGVVGRLSYLKAQSLTNIHVRSSGCCDAAHWFFGPDVLHCPLWPSVPTAFWMRTWRSSRQLIKDSPPTSLLLSRSLWSNNGKPWSCSPSYVQHLQFFLIHSLYDALLYFTQEYLTANTCSSHSVLCLFGTQVTFNRWL